MKYFYFFLLLLAFAGCKEPQKVLTLPEKPEIVGLATPITLGLDSTMVYLQDFFPNVSVVDSVTLPQNFLGDYDEEDKLLIINSLPKNIPPISELKVWAKGFPYSIILKRPKRFNVAFSSVLDSTKFLAAKPQIVHRRGSRKAIFLSPRTPEIKLIGDMNLWDKAGISLRKSNDTFSTNLSLDAGKYAYRLLIGGRERTDPNNKDSVANVAGGYNSVLTVGNLDETKLPQLFTQSFDNQLVTITTTNSPSSIFALWENFRVDVKPENGTYKIRIPVQAGQFERSCLRVFSYNAAGESNDLLVPLRNGKVITNAAELNRNDRQTDVLYFLPVNRFFDGDTLNNHLSKVVKQEVPIRVKRGRKRGVKMQMKTIIVTPKNNNYCGDLLGILKKLEGGYFQKLGINTLWVSPIVQNPTGTNVVKSAPIRRGRGRKQRTFFAKPAVVNANKPTFTLGNELILQDIVKEAHHQNINVLLDLVLNPPQPTPVQLSKPYVPTPRKLKKKRRHRASIFINTQYISPAPTDIFTRPEIVKAMTDSVVFWIKKYDLDGFRHDTLTLNNSYFLRALTHKLKRKIIIPQKKTLYQIGENRRTHELIASYIGAGLQDAQLDFPLFEAARSVFATENEPFTKLANALKTSLNFYGNHHLMYNSVEKTGVSRFISYLTGTLTLPENNPTNTFAYKKLLQIHAFDATIPGVPSVYFGDEIGRIETDDHDLMHGMKFENLTSEEENVKIATEKLLKLRRSNMALLFGDFDVIQADDKTLAYSRSYFEKTVAVFFNKSNAEIKIQLNLPPNMNIATMKAQFGNQISVENLQMTVTLPPHSFEIVLN